MSCNNAKQNESTDNFEKRAISDTIEEIETTHLPNDSLNFITSCDTIPLQLLSLTRKRHSLTTFQKPTFIYCSPSTESKIIDSIPINTEIVSWKPIIRTYRPKEIERDGKLVVVNRVKEIWYETEINGKIGYLAESDLSIKKLSSTILFGEIPNEYGYRILSFDSKNSNQLIDSMKLNRNHGYEIESIIYNGLDLCKGVIRYRDFRQSCPGTSSTTFVSINNQGGFNKLLSSFNGTEASSTIFFPLKFISGKTLLVADGNENEIFNFYSGELNTFSYPKEINVPINQLIVETRIEYAEDIEGLSAEEIKITKSDTIYYRWNGTELKEIKTSGK